MLIKLPNLEEQLMPTERRKVDSVLQTAVDRRDLAVIANYFGIKGVINLNKSTLVRMAIETFSTALVKNGYADYESTHEASELLDNLGITGLNPRKRLYHNLADNLRLDGSDDLLDSETEPEYEEERVTYREQQAKATEQMLAKFNSDQIKDQPAEKPTRESAFERILKRNLANARQKPLVELEKISRSSTSQ